MERAYAGVGKFVFACLILFGLAAIALLGTNLGTTLALSSGYLQFIASTHTASTPAAVVAARFPSADASLPLISKPFATANVLPVENWEMFSPAPFSLTAYAAPLEPAFPDEAKPVSTIPVSVPVTKPLATAAAAAPPAPPATTKAEPIKTAAINSAATAAARRATNRPSNVLNDAQIANIKRRLNLSPDQEQMWPAVETALRRIVYTKNSAEARVHAAQAGANPMAYVDPSSEEVQQLKYAALPLIMRLSDDQRREVKMMAHVMGLEGIASQF